MTAIASNPSSHQPFSALSPLRPNITSEVNRLQDVLVHRPGDELQRVTPANRHRFLFDEVVWPTRAQEEHQAFTSALRREGVRVHQVGDLLSDALEGPTRRRVVSRSLERSLVSPRAASWIRDWLCGLDARRLADVLIAGLTPHDLPASHSDGLLRLLRDLPDEQFLIQPVPNLMFVRDSSIWIGRNFLTASMTYPARRREPLILETIYDQHPLFAPGADSAGNTRLLASAPIEGGDALVADEHLLLLAVGERTSIAGVERLAGDLFSHDRDARILLIILPDKRSSMHLDTLVTFVDSGTILLHPFVRECPVYSLAPHDHGVRAERQTDIGSAVRARLHAELRILEPDRDAIGLAREQWDDGNNVLAVAPGRVIAYESNELTNRYLEEQGIDVIRVPGSELRRARGGPHCLSCPIRRGDARNGISA